MKKQQKSEDLDVKLGSDDMVYWQGIVDSEEREKDMTEKKLRFVNFVLDNAKKELEKATKEFESK